MLACINLHDSLVSVKLQIKYFLLFYKSRTLHPNHCGTNLQTNYFVPYLEQKSWQHFFFHTSCVSAAAQLLPVVSYYTEFCPT